LILLWAHVPIVLIFGLVRGFGLGRCLLAAGEVGAFAVFASKNRQSRTFISIVSALGLLTSSAVLVDLSGGSVEMHFHFFVMIGVLTLYEDWLPFLIAVAFVLVHHAVLGALSPDSVFSEPAARAKPLLWAAIHAFFVAAAGLVYIVAWRLNEDVRAKLATSEARFRNAFANAPIGMCLVDLEGRYVRVNAALCAILGRSEDELLGSSFVALTHPDDRVASTEGWGRLRDGEALTYQVEKRYLHADGHIVWALVSVSVVPGANGAPEHFVSQIQDIGERKRAEEALKVSMDKLQAAAEDRRLLLDRTVRAAEDERIRVASELHDGPVQHLTALDMRLEALRMRLDVADVPAEAYGAERVQEQLRAEINGLRRMMKELRPPALDERGLEAALRDYVGRVAAEHGLEGSVESQIAGRLPPTLDTILYRVAQEAITNVVKHASAHGFSLALQAMNGRIEMDIRDDGVGFDPEDGARKASRGHYGLIGMRERVASAGGALAVESRPGEGTCIHVVLPREVSVS
jgi:PAS domain S-box-containing protein